MFVAFKFSSISLNHSSSTFPPSFSEGCKSDSFDAPLPSCPKTPESSNFLSNGCRLVWWTGQGSSWYSFFWVISSLPLAYFNRIVQASEWICHRFCMFITFPHTIHDVFVLVRALVQSQEKREIGNSRGRDNLVHFLSTLPFTPVPNDQHLMRNMIKVVREPVEVDSLGRTTTIMRISTLLTQF